jgi:4-amino-4-deoxy-L-arabinose transferase-like glycosyltransferase
MGLTAWGLVGGLDGRIIRWLTVLAACYGAIELFRTRQGGSAQNECNALGSRAQGVPRLALLVALLCLAAAGGSLLSALAPAVAGDALCYHLELPKQFLARGAIEYLPLHENSTFPLLTEMWFLWALALDSAVAAQLVHWGLGLLMAGATVLLARPMIGHRPAWLAGAVVLMVPGVTNQMAAPLNDVALAVFTTLALAAWQRAICHSERSEESPPASPLRRETLRCAQGDKEWLLVAGVMAGAALAIKYVALVLALAVGALWCGTFLRRAGQRGALLRGAAVVWLFAALIAGGWYARAAYHRGNPVYPFLSSLAGGDGPPTMRESKTPLKWNARDLLTAPWQVTMQPARFGGRGHQLGGLFLVALPAVLLIPCRPLWPFLGISAVYVALWYALRQNVRFLLPLVPILAAGAAAALVDLGRWPALPRAIGLAACGSVIVLGALIPAYRARQHVRVALGLESREEFLGRCEPAYRAARFVNAHLPPDAHLLSQDFRAFYFERAFTRENAYRQATRYPQQLTAPANLAPHLLAEGFTHLLLVSAPSAGRARSLYNDTLERCVEVARAADPTQFVTLAEYDFRGTDGLRHYRLVELRPASAAIPYRAAAHRAKPSER